MKTQIMVTVVVTVFSIILAIILGPIVISSNGTEDVVNNTVNNTVVHFPPGMANGPVNLNVVQEQHNQNVVSTPEEIRSIKFEFADYFSEDNSNWHTHPDDDDCETYIDDGMLQFNKISGESDALFRCNLDGYSPPENFIVEFNATINRNKHDGLIGISFRRVDTDNCYYFIISREGKYMFGKKENGHRSAIIPWTNSSSIKEGTETNTLKVKCERNAFTFYINEIEVNSCTDSSFPYGGIALVAGVGDNSLNKNKFSFDNFKVWSIKYLDEE